MLTGTGRIPPKIRRYVAEQGWCYRHLNISCRYEIRQGSEAFLPNTIDKKRFNSLVKAGIVEIIYSSSGLSMENLYGELLREINQKKNVQIGFKEYRITRPEHIFENLSREDLAGDVRTCLLVRQTLANIPRICNIRDLFMFKLEFLTSASLEKIVTNTEIEVAIRSPNEKLVKEFLIKTGVLLIKVRKSHDLNTLLNI